MNLIDRLNALDARRQAWPSSYVLEVREISRYRAFLMLSLTHESCAIEGNPYDLPQVLALLAHGQLAPEHDALAAREITNHRDAMVLMSDLLREDQPVSAMHIRQLHYLLLRDIEPEAAGRYRTSAVSISGAAFTPMAAFEVPAAMDDLLGWYAGAEILLHPVLCAAELHARFIQIHPFVDGNGRTGRLLMTLALLQAGYPAAIIRALDRLDYYAQMEAWCVNRDIEPFATAVIDALMVACEGIEGSEDFQRCRDNETAQREWDAMVLDDSVVPIAIETPEQLEAVREAFPELSELLPDNYLEMRAFLNSREPMTLH